jgi:Tfp pilus assembly protein PilV
MRGVAREDGFALLEALVAGGMLAGGVLGLIQVLVVASAATRAARQTTAATLLAVEKVEALRAAPFDATAGEEEIGEYRRAWRVEAADDDPLGSLDLEVVVDPGGVRLRTRRTLTAP